MSYATQNLEKKYGVDLTKPVAIQPTTYPFRTWRIEVQGTGRVLLTGFSSPSPSFRTDPRKDAAEFSNEATAHRIARKLENAMNERCRAMNLPDAATLCVTEAIWDDRGIEAWDAVQRLDRTSVEVGRFEAAYLPFNMRNGVGR